MASPVQASALFVALCLHTLPKQQAPVKLSRHRQVLIEGRMAALSRYASVSYQEAALVTWSIEVCLDKTALHSTALNQPRTFHLVFHD